MDSKFLIIFIIYNNSGKISIKKVIIQPLRHQGTKIKELVTLIPPGTEHLSRDLSAR
jgi:hypothetical protein